MANNAQVTPLGLSLNRHARAKALDQIWKRGLSLPCQVVSVKGSIVQVAFQIAQPPGSAAVTLPNVTIPVHGSEYIRFPIQAGCKGVAQASDAYLGGMSGIGGGVASLTQPGNLTALTFHPIGNANWFSVDGNVLVMYGPNGVTLMDQNINMVVNLTPTGLTATIGAIVFQQTAAGFTFTGPVTFDGDVAITGAFALGVDGTDYTTHVHSGVVHGGANSGPPVPGS